MNKQETLKLFNESVADAPVGYKSLYECECPHLHRNVGFRQQFKELVLQDITTKNSQTNPLVYVSQGPGGFLWDFYLINSLIHAGYQQLTLIFIEPLYEKNIAILQAYLDMQSWCKELSAAYAQPISITTHLFKSFKEYEQACMKTSSLRGNLLVTVDPDDKKTIPDFDRITFRTKFSGIAAKTMLSTASFYYLFFQKIGNNPYRHMLLGRALTTPEQSILAMKHIYGEDLLHQKAHNRVFLNKKEVLPYMSTSPNEINNIQIGKDVLYSSLIGELLQDPLV